MVDEQFKKEFNLKLLSILEIGKPVFDKESLSEIFPYDSFESMLKKVKLFKSLLKE